MLFVNVCALTLKYLEIWWEWNKISKLRILGYTYYCLVSATLTLNIRRSTKYICSIIFCRYAYGIDIGSDVVSFSLPAVTAANDLFPPVQIEYEHIYVSSFLIFSKYQSCTEILPAVTATNNLYPPVQIDYENVYVSSFLFVIKYQSCTEIMPSVSFILHKYLDSVCIIIDLLSVRSFVKFY